MVHDKLDRLRITGIQVCTYPETTTETLKYVVYKQA